VSIKSLVLIVTSICSVFLIYQLQSSPDIEGRNFHLSLSFQNTLNRPSKDSEFSVSLPYSFKTQSSALYHAQTKGLDERSIQLVFGQTPKYSGQSVEIAGVITDSVLPDVVTELSDCLSPLIKEVCLQLISESATPEKVFELAEQSFEANQQLLLSQGFDEAKWTNLVALYRLAHLKVIDGYQVRFIKGINPKLNSYEADIWLEIRKPQELVWQPTDESFSKDQWLAIYIYPEFGGTLADLRLIHGYGLDIVNSKLEIESQQILNK
jgi:hypothetical protein